MDEKNVLVLGLGHSGEAAAKLLLNTGHRVTVVDGGAHPALLEVAHMLHRRGASVLTSCKNLPDEDFDFCVTSPGISTDAPWMKELNRRGTYVMSELELGWRHTESQVLAVSGSNGKSTVVGWLTEILRSLGWEAEPVGNFGTPFSEAVGQKHHPDWWVVEVSSFQLETVRSFRPSLAILLNVLPNHLDRHGSMEAYLRTKLRLFQYMGSGTTGIIPYSLAKDITSRCSSGISWQYFGEQEEADYRWSGNGVKTPSGEFFSLAWTLFQGKALGVNAAAVIAAVESFRGKPERAIEIARHLKPLPHRLEKVGEGKGIIYVNDSKATNLAAMEAALNTMDRPVRLIAGGRAKEKDFNSVKEVLAEKVSSVYLIGEVAETMQKAWGEVVPCLKTEQLERAFRAAVGDAQRGEIVLLSPGCTSFDQYGGFEERGSQFTELVTMFLKEE